MSKTIDKKKKMQIRRAILKFEKEKKLWPPSYLGDAEHQNSLDGIEKDYRNFHIKIHLGIPNSYHDGGSIIYIVNDKKTNIKYRVKHYFPNVSFCNVYDWYIEEIEQ